MELKIRRNKLEIHPSPTLISDNNLRNLDEAFIEEVLGLKEEGDFVLLTRKNYGPYRLGHLETIKPRAKVSSIEYGDGSADVFIDISNEDLEILNEEAKK